MLNSLIGIGVIVVMTIRNRVKQRMSEDLWVCKVMTWAKKKGVGFHTDHWCVKNETH
jgi:hypothetical protein